MPTEYNPQLVDNMSAKFRRLNNPAHAMADAIGMLQMFPGVVGIWPGSVAGGGSGNQNMLVDVSGNALHLTKNGGTLFGATDLRSYITYNGSTGYYSHADANIFDIVGNESYIAGAVQGLTIGGWFYVADATPATSEYLIGKGINTYVIQHITSANTLRFRVYDGATAYAVGSVVPAASNWYFVCGRYDPSTAVSIKVNNADFEDFTTSIPAALNTNSAGFAIGADAAGTNFFNGRACLSFLCAAAVPDVFIDTFFQFTAPLFGVTV